MFIKIFGLVIHNNRPWPSGLGTILLRLITGIRISPVGPIFPFIYKHMGIHYGNDVDEKLAKS